MRDANPKATYLKDYAPPDYLIDSVDLVLELDAEQTRVTARMTVRRNPASGTELAPLRLNGENLVLEQVSLDDQQLSAYQLTDAILELPEVPQDRPFQLVVVNTLCPRTNTALEGLYLSKDMLCTQCEAEGFRKITFFPDRPDVLARFRTRLIADPDRYPVLLANGNLREYGQSDDGLHWALWEDPFPKPCYLFAVVAGQLACLEDHFVTSSGRNVALRIYVEPQDLDKCDHAMASLKNAMRWDEQVYGREYDLDLYMIVAVGHFNMGAMENKGLNIFNTQYVLARPDTATDDDYEHIEGVIGHEYFHNWSGNRVTCRDWFQLSLKEGFTVYRDQEFTADQTSRAVKRIDDVSQLRTLQFAEDQGPMAHPVRPDSYIEINNFYTVTVYEKGAEVVRMIATLLGAQTFRKACDLYFQRHDGQAVTCDDFVRTMEDASGLDLSQFKRWYQQAGTPTVSVSSAYDASARQFSLTLSQIIPPTPGQAVKQPMLIPIAMGLLATDDGAPLTARLSGESESRQHWLLQLREQQQTFTFEQVEQAPVASLLRGFSAPVKLDYPRPPETLAFLLRHDSDAFNRWDAGQSLFAESLLAQLAAGQQAAPPALWLEGMAHLIEQDWEDLSYLARLLTPPSEIYLAEQMPVVDVIGIHRLRERYLTALAEQCQASLYRLYQQHHRAFDQARDNQSIGRRRIANVCLNLLTRLPDTDWAKLADRHYHQAGNMTDQLAALMVIVHRRLPGREQVLEQFYQTWREQPLVIDKWFRVQATAPVLSTLTNVQQLLNHADFDLAMPNRARALVGAFSQGNPVCFHDSSGCGYDYLAERILELNRLNPQVAARMLKPLTQWRRFDEARQELMKAQLQRILAEPSLSPDVYEITSKSLSIAD